MRPSEFDDFKRELQQLCATFGKQYTDAIGQAYWRVLRDVSLNEVQANVERVIFSAKADSKFPKPFELRTTPTAQQGELPDAARRHNDAGWREKFAKAPQRAGIEFKWCQAQRILASTDMGSVQYAEALKIAHSIEKQHGDPRWWKHA